MPLIIYGVAFGTLSSIAVKNKNRDQAGWFFIGFLFGVFGLIAAALVDKVEPPKTEAKPQATFDPSALTKKCPDCAETIKLEAKVCRFCQHKFSDDEVANQIKLVQNEFDAKRDTQNKEPVFLHKNLMAWQWECPNCHRVNMDVVQNCVDCKTQRPRTAQT